MYLTNPGRDEWTAFCNLPKLGLWRYKILGWRIYEHPMTHKITLDHKTETDWYFINVERNISSFASWYQIFPRSFGAIQNKDGSWKSGTFREAANHLSYIKKHGFNIVYLSPIHPIGKSFRKGKNNSLNAGEFDPGSPWGIGNEEGGHDVVRKELGGEEGLKFFIKEAKKKGIEVSLDYALQTSPDHPWVKEHRNWFGVREDGTIAYAENPPKKYQDIYPIVFDNDPDGIVKETLRLWEKWIKLGIKIFRIDNPHTKPVWFWEEVIRKTKAKYPDTVFLAEAFTKPPMMMTLALAGYDQSHSYFLWRDQKKEIERYLIETTSNPGFWLRPTFWPTTPDNLTEVLVKGGITAHKIRALLAATGSTSWGIYSGYEFNENEWNENKKEHNDNEKYEFKPRDWNKVTRFGISDFLAKLNQIRNSEPVFHSIHNLMLHKTNDRKILAFGRHQEFKNEKNKSLSASITEDIIVVINLDFENAHEFNLEIKWKDLLKLRPSLSEKQPETIKATDLLSGKSYILNKKTTLKLDPKIKSESQVGLILKLNL